ncbi:hypothetical protein GCM10017556_01270 [Micromonospora sagamiensis]|nr:hypothetical protein GCM10017556_01270 [Micromonospora sagamiensis]
MVPVGVVPVGVVPVGVVPVGVVPVGVVPVETVTWAAVTWLQGSVPAVGDGVQRAQLRVRTPLRNSSLGHDPEIAPADTAHPPRRRRQ